MKSIISLAILELLSVYFSTPETAWYVDDIVDSVQIIVLAILLAYHVRSNLPMWCMVVAYALCEYIEMMSNMIWYAFDVYNPWLDMCRITAAMVMLTYYRMRRYDIQSDELVDGYIYMTYRKPRKLQDRVLSLVGLPLGGVGVYSHGRWYRYHRGVFIISKCNPSHNHVIIRKKVYEKAPINLLESMAGTKWGILNNCITELIPIVHLGRRLPFLPTLRY